MSDNASIGRRTGNGEEPGAGGFQAWHLFVIATLLASTAAAVAVRGTSPVNVVFVCLVVFAAGAASFGVYRTLWPLVHPESVESPQMAGGRTRAAIEREKALVLRAIKEIEFDRAMGKVSEADWQDMTSRLRARAVGLIRQLDSATTAYREVIEKELAARAASGGGPVAGAVLAIAVALGALGGAAPAVAQTGGAMGMPDARAMSGIPLPSPSLAVGSVSVRLVRVDLSNTIAGHPVDFTVAGRSEVVVTDAEGRAIVSGLAPGTAVQAIATVDGERLESQAIQVPAQGGIAVLLVASGQAGGAPPADAAVPGRIALGGQSRVVVQFADDELQVFLLLDLVNPGRAPIVPAAPIVFAMPAGAMNTAVLEGSSPSASATGPHVTVSGPFAPGSTSVQVAFGMPPGGSAAIRLPLPVDYPLPTVIVEKVGSMGVSSAQLPTMRSAQDPQQRFVLASGPAIPAGQVLSFEITGIPHHAEWPRNVALALVGLILCGGAWTAWGRQAQPRPAPERAALEQRREALYGELVRLERRRNASEEAGPGRQERRQALLGELEQIYAELDAPSEPAGQGTTA